MDAAFWNDGNVGTYTPGVSDVRARETRAQKDAIYARLIAKGLSHEEASMALSRNPNPQHGGGGGRPARAPHFNKSARLSDLLVDLGASQGNCPAGSVQSGVSPTPVWDPATKQYTLANLSRCTRVDGDRHHKGRSTMQPRYIRQRRGTAAGFNNAWDEMPGTLYKGGTGAPTVGEAYSNWAVVGITVGAAAAAALITAWATGAFKRRGAKA